MALNEGQAYEKAVLKLKKHMRETTVDEPSKMAHLQRKLTILHFNYSKKGSDNSATIHLLEKDLEKYLYLMEERDGYNYYVESAKELIEKSAFSSVIGKKWDLNLSEEGVDPFKNGIPICKGGNSPCLSAGKATVDDVKLLNCLKKNKDIAPAIKLEKAFQNMNNSLKRERDETSGSSSNELPSFRTAATELKVQNAKKLKQEYVPCSNLKLGNSKFRVPFKKSEEEQAKAAENENELDKRDLYKHLDKKLVEMIKSEIMYNGERITWDDISGLSYAKDTIQEIIIWPILRPELFKGLRKPPKGILLFGPPGTGKTLIGKCVASQSKSTFFSISASSLTSKWMGESEKLVRTMFEVARIHQPSVIFMDEIDSLLSQRTDSENDASRRIKTEFLVQLDGATTNSNEQILVIGATNRPQELDEAARRRFIKRLYVPLPDLEARRQIVTKLMQTEENDLTREQFDQIALDTEGYSGADVKNLCADASMGPIRELDLKHINSVETVRPVSFRDFVQALHHIRSSVSTADLQQYMDWNEKYGSNR